MRLLLLTYVSLLWTGTTAFNLGKLRSSPEEKSVGDNVLLRGRNLDTMLEELDTGDATRDLYYYKSSKSPKSPKGPKSPKSPKGPKSPKSPKSPKGPKGCYGKGYGKGDAPYDKDCPCYYHEDCEMGYQCCYGDCIPKGTPCGSTPPGPCSGDDDCESNEQCCKGDCIPKGVPCDPTPPGPCTSDDHCDSGYQCCDGDCIPDSYQCGPCSDTNPCKSGYQCCDGDCIPNGYQCGPCTSDDDCESNDQCCDGNCIPKGTPCGSTPPGPCGKHTQDCCVGPVPCEDGLICGGPNDGTANGKCVLKCEDNPPGTPIVCPDCPTSPGSPDCQPCAPITTDAPVCPTCGEDGQACCPTDGSNLDDKTACDPGLKCESGTCVPDCSKLLETCGSLPFGNELNGDACGCCGDLACFENKCCIDSLTATGCGTNGDACCGDLTCENDACCVPPGAGTCSGDGDCCGDDQTCDNGTCCRGAFGTCEFGDDFFNDKQCCDDRSCVSGGQCCGLVGDVGCEGNNDLCCGTSECRLPDSNGRPNVKCCAPTLQSGCIIGAPPGQNHCCEETDYCNEEGKCVSCLGPGEAKCGDSSAGAGDANDSCCGTASECTVQDVLFGTNPNAKCCVLLGRDGCNVGVFDADGSATRDDNDALCCDAGAICDDSTCCFDDVGATCGKDSDCCGDATVCFGGGCCKAPQKPCDTDTDCCGGSDNAQCKGSAGNTKCCIQNNKTGCKQDGDCCQDNGECKDIDTSTGIGICRPESSQN